MSESSLGRLPDLVIITCPLGCNGKCTGMWRNEITGHSIICKCKCEHGKGSIRSKGTRQVNENDASSDPKRASVIQPLGHSL